MITEGAKIKIKVRSRYKEGIAVTGRVWEGARAYLQFRQFAPPHAKANWGETYMSPAEAKFLVESSQNRAHIDAGLEPEYSYPAGFPVPVHDNMDGVLHPPLSEKNFHISDSRQLDQAAGWLAERDAAIALENARASAEERGDDPGEIDPLAFDLPDEPGPGRAPGRNAPETPIERRARMKAEREATRVTSPL